MRGGGGGEDGRLMLLRPETPLLSLLDADLSSTRESIVKLSAAS